MPRKYCIAPKLTREYIDHMASLSGKFLMSHLLGNRDNFCRTESIISVRKRIKFLVFYSYRASFTCLVCSHAWLASDAFSI